MANNKLLEEISARLSELAASTPVVDIEKNAKALLSSFFSRMDLVTREEFELQREMLAKAREKLTTLEAGVDKLVAELESQNPSRK